MAKIKVFTGELLDTKTQEKLSYIENLKGVEKVVALPFCRIKEHLETPTKLVTGTKEYIYKDLTTPTIGCSIGAIKTSLKKDDFNKEKALSFYKNILNQEIPGQTKLERFLIWIGLRRRKDDKYYPNEKELQEILVNGGKSIARKYNLGEVGEIEDEGNSLTRKVDKRSLGKYIPRAALKNGPHNIGYWWRHNHFLDIQYVEEILDEVIAQELGLKKDDITITYHQQAGQLPYLIGRYFGEYKKHTLKDTLRFIPAKILFHFFSIDGLLNFWERLVHYFGTKPFKFLEKNSIEGKRYWLATRVGLNYMYAARIAMFKRIMESLKKIFNNEIEIAFISEGPHTNITEEDVGGEKLLIHRNGAARIRPGKPFIIAGSKESNSYICLGLPTAEKWLYSAPHTINLKEASEEIGEKSLDISGKDLKIEELKQKKSLLGLEQIKKLENEGILKLVATLRPIATYSDK